MKLTHIYIQPYIVGGVKHYRARPKIETERYRFETNPEETLDEFRGRIMNALNSGIVTHFEETWRLK